MAVNITSSLESAKEEAVRRAMGAEESEESESAPSEAGELERTGEAVQASTAETACRAACATSYAALCVRVQQICAGSTVVTVGGIAIPCATGVATTCLTSTALAVVCADRCPP
jgi:hypothetical protein